MKECELIEAGHTFGFLAVSSLKKDNSGNIVEF